MKIYLSFFCVSLWVARTFSTHSSLYISSNTICFSSEFCYDISANPLDADEFCSESAFHWDVPAEASPTTSIYQPENTIPTPFHDGAISVTLFNGWVLSLTASVADGSLDITINRPATDAFVSLWPSTAALIEKYHRLDMIFADKKLKVPLSEVWAVQDLILSQRVFDRPPNFSLPPRNIFSYQSQRERYEWLHYIEFLPFTPVITVTTFPKNSHLIARYQYSGFDYILDSGYYLSVIFFLFAGYLYSRYLFIELKKDRLRNDPVARRKLRQARGTKVPVLVPEEEEHSDF